MTIKAVFFDIDGTLVSFNTHQVPQSAKQALQTMRERGVRVFICTGRPLIRAGFITQAADFDFDGIIAMNGQYCQSKGHLIYHQPIARDNLENVLPYLEEQHIACDFVESDYMYINCMTETVSTFRKKLGRTVEPEPVDDVSRINDHPVYQICPFVTREEETEILRRMPDCRAVRWHPAFADIIPKDGGKASGIREVLRYYGIKQEETMAFGDGGNDLDMLLYAGIGVAMGNAEDEVRKTADYVTASVDNDGVAKALKLFQVI